MFRVAAISAIFALAAAPALAADGAHLFNTQCKMCHVTFPMGPKLAGVAGGKIAAGAFNYSPALKAHGGDWTDENLNAFLKGPAAFAPGTKMQMSVPDDENRAAIIAYLKTLK